MLGVMEIYNEWMQEFKWTAGMGNNKNRRSK